MKPSAERPERGQRAIAIVKRAAAHRRAGLILALFVVWGVFSIANPVFATWNSGLALAETMSTVAIIGAGLTLVLVCGEIDLSVGAVYSLVGVVAADLFLHGWSVPALIVAALLVGVGVGVVNGILSTYARLPSFIVTLGTMSMALGAATIVSGGTVLSPAGSGDPKLAGRLEDLSALTSTSLPFDIPMQALWMVVSLVILAVVLNRTTLGFRMSASGSNPDAAEIAGIRVFRVKTAAFVLSGLMAAVAGIVDLSAVGSADPTAGSALTFPVFAAVVIGGTSLLGGEGTMFGTALGSLLLAIITVGITITSVLSLYQLVFVGGITVLAVAIDRWTTRPGVGARA
jgi:ribose/xylose/arabinose/galactoside ABC-type transport system permease subunit